MKGSLHTDELMAEVVRKDTGIRTARRISHVFIMDVPTYAKLLFITDAAVKHITSTVAGDADILLVPDLEAGNMLAKEPSFLANADAAGIVLGTRVPIMLTSRADNVRARMASCAIAALYAHARRVIAAGIGKLAG
jgi:phosphotransacetylase